LQSIGSKGLDCDQGPGFVLGLVTAKQVLRLRRRMTISKAKDDKFNGMTISRLVGEDGFASGGGQGVDGAVGGKTILTNQP
jgi:hypothetical protein